MITGVISTTTFLLLNLEEHQNDLNLLFYLSHFSQRSWATHTIFFVLHCFVTDAWPDIERSIELVWQWVWTFPFYSRDENLWLFAVCSPTTLEALSMVRNVLKEHLLKKCLALIEFPTPSPKNFRIWKVYSENYNTALSGTWSICGLKKKKEWSLKTSLGMSKLSVPQR